MHDARRLDQLRALLRVHDVLANDAVIALGHAHVDERDADDIARADRDRMTAVADDWFRHLSKSFAPEHGIAIAATLVAQERTARLSESKAAAACHHRIACERSWRVAYAHRCATREIVDALTRRRSRKADERALARVADRTTSDWTRT